MNIKNVFFALFPEDFSPTILAALFVCFRTNCFVRFFPPFFGYDIRVNIKNVFAHYSDDFFPNIFCTHYSFISGKLVLRVFPTLLGHDIRVNIKNVLSHFFQTIVFLHFLLALFVCF